MAAETVLEELTRDELTAAHVEHRVDDWVGRIETVYADAERWLPNHWSARRSRTDA